MKKIATIAAIAAFTTLAACGAKEEAPVANETVANETVANETVDAPEEKTGGPCGDGTVLRENEKCK